MTGLDWAALGIVVLSAIAASRQGLVAAALWLGGLIGGAVVGGRLASGFLTHGSRSPYAPLIALAGAAVGAIVLQTAGAAVGLSLRQSFRRQRALRVMDSIGGLALGAAAGFAAVWVLGAVALVAPGQTSLRRDVQRSLILRRLNSLLPPRDFLRALGRVDPFPRIVAPPATVPPPNPAVLRRPGVRAAAPSVVRVVGTACGLGVVGTGWVAAPNLVVTAAHVVAGERDTRVEPPGGGALPAQAVDFDPHDDVAVLRVSGLSRPPLRLVAPRAGTAVAILGYPGDGPFTATPGRVGATAVVLTQDAYGHGPVAREITSVRGTVRHGDSGGPAVDASGAVQTTVFAARVGGNGGFGVPAATVRRALRNVTGPVSTGPCA